MRPGILWRATDGMINAPRALLKGLQPTEVRSHRELIFECKQAAFIAASLGLFEHGIFDDTHQMKLKYFYNKPAQKTSNF